jgi:hypothetical protein
VRSTPRDNGPNRPNPKSGIDASFNDVLGNNWSALEDDFRTFLAVPGGSGLILQQFTT